MGEIAQFGERCADLVDGGLDQLGERGVTARRGGRSGDLQVVGHAEQALLGAVVEVAFETAASGVGGLDDAGS